MLIDWEYARLGDPADEIGYVFTQNNLGAAHRAALWRRYARAMTVQTLDRLSHRVGLREPITLLGSIMWWLDAWARAEATPAWESEPSLSRTADYYLQVCASLEPSGLDAGRS